MSSLFSNLPPESADKHIREAENEFIPPNKRLKTEVAAPLDAQVKTAQLTGKDPVATALIKITSHIGSSKKFTKASELLRQLILEHKIGQEHSKLVFEALKASLREPSSAEDPQLRREYLKLFTLASKAADMFTAREKSQLDVYGIWSVTRNQLHTDDSFTFNRTIKSIKESISHLPDATEEEEEALQTIKARLPEEPQLPELDSSGCNDCEPPEADPFGLDALITQDKRKIKLMKPSTWSSKEILGMKREALLDCFDTMKACYGRPWARTSVDLAIEDLNEHREKFCSSQQARIQDMMQFVQQQRLRRKQGVAAASRESQRDTTAFENARKEWGRATISARGKVGAGGDHQSETWLG
ncbi:hypothetical protein ABBQ32_007767 [Trebouxia sp. C0010 RCD-2024]